MTSRFLSLTCLAMAPLLIGSASAVVIDNFNDESLSEYTLTRVLDNNTASNISFSATGGTLSTTVSGGVSNVPEQVLFLRDDHSLEVGQTLLIDTTITSNLATANIVNDFGIAIGTTETPAGLTTGTSGDVRASSSYLYISVRPNQDSIRAGYANNAAPVTSFTAATTENLVAQLFITRTAANSFEVGYYTTSDTKVTLDLNGASAGNEFTFTSALMGTSVGFYADVRHDQTVGFMDNLAIVPEPSSAALLGAFGLLGIMRRRRA
ncbi:PEP-CTERM sorting domain-containing protein [Luteolibacter luteus]|uniref:PEP-CTERM sorting domain-containing protein n=1 Tax=Luteolibacter luteus TaxID=2728835 RepID=A0A858RMA6_9BACT|nr:PEP-CTERM sorting domain-containing protein [Luteolibacter luteus]QJE98526.1 PEP-CTERM sorting domain-containing protein [Luteolibacter luteus]